jgi:hypothetical protein
VSGTDLANRAARRVYRRLRRMVRPQSQSLRPRQVRLVPEPVFLLSNVRSGSTLLRAVLDSHSQICAPIEMHLKTLNVSTDQAITRQSLKHLQLSFRDLENMLWDRVLWDQLLRSGKSIIVDKTPGNALIWRRMHRYWPNSKFILLYRHPVRIVESWSAARPTMAYEDILRDISTFTETLVEAGEGHGGLVVRYEDLTRNPAEVTKQICDYLGVRWEPEMVEYGAKDHGPFERGFGDWSEKIASGRIAPAEPDPLPDEVPDELKEACRLMGYL